MNARIKIDLPVIVEGKYDKIKLQSLLDAHIITTDGFGVFNAAEKRALLRRLCEKSKVIVLTDSDGAGLLIRSHLRSILPPDRVIHLYTPRLDGKEKRKKVASREGILGVEGMEASLLRDLFRPYAANGDEPRPRSALTKGDFFVDGLSGTCGSAALRAALAKKLSLPPNMSANALLEAVNMICSPQEYRAALNKISKETGN